MSRGSALLAALLAAHAALPPCPGAPAWRTPGHLPFGELSVLELAEDDPTQPALPRPGEERLGSLVLRGVEPTADGRGWRLTVQPMVPGTVLVPPVDFGDGRRSPELRIVVPRTVPFRAPWMGVGGGREDLIPQVPFPWAWAALLLAPLAVPAGWLWRKWVRAAPSRLRRRHRAAFARHWPPLSADRRTLDIAHALGRDLLAVHFGDDARSWGSREFRSRGLEVWSAWIQSLDAARFSRKDPPFPPLAALLKCLGERP